MDPRFHAALDGDLPMDALSPDERAELARTHEALGRVAGALRSVPVPDLTTRVMAHLPVAAPRRPLLHALEWLWRPQPIRIALRPAYALAIAAAALLLTVPREGPPEAPPAATVVPSAPSSPILVQFRLAAPDAHRVSLAGTFTDWQPAVELPQTTPGEWTALVPLAPGVHDYAFVVDGEQWVPDPHAPGVDDDFGGTNSRLSLPPLAARS